MIQVETFDGDSYQARVMCQQGRRLLVKPAAEPNGCHGTPEGEQLAPRWVTTDEVSSDRLCECDGEKTIRVPVRGGHVDVCRDCGGLRSLLGRIQPPEVV